MKIGTSGMENTAIPQLKGENNPPVETFGKPERVFILSPVRGSIPLVSNCNVLETF